MMAARILWLGETGVLGVNDGPLASYTRATLPFETYVTLVEHT